MLRSSLEEVNREQLLDIVIRQQQIIRQQGEIIDEQKDQNKKLKGRLAEMEKEMEELTRQMHRQAAPFGRPEEKRKKNPKRPGRKTGHPGSYRPTPQSVDRHVDVPLEECPHCAGSITEVQEVEQYIEELPPPQVEVIRLTTYRAKCENCGTVESDHPLKTSRATGAAKCQLGPHAQVLATQLLYDFGLTRSKTSRLLHELFGLEVSKGGLVHLSHKMSKRCQSDYQALKDKVKEASVLYADETSWYVGSPKHYLWFFGNTDIALYLVADNRRRENIEDIIGQEFAGVLVSDCLVVYDDVNPVQQKCYAHHLKAISQALRHCEDESKVYINDLRQLLKAALLLKSIQGDIRKEQYDEGVRSLKATAESLLKWPRDNDLEEKIANRLRKQQDHLFTFLHHAHVDGTNNLAERMLRPAVISRKLSCGNKTDKGAQSWQILTSMINTNRLSNIDNRAYLMQKVRSIH